VANSVTTVTATPTLSDSTATVQVTGGTGLVVGANTVTAKVTAQDGTTIKTYTIVVSRLPSSNANLSALAISSGTLSPVFTSSGTSYTATVSNSVTGVTITPTLSDSTATVQVTGGTGLVVGTNTVTAKVTAQDGVTTKTYTIVVSRLSSSNANLSALTITSGTLSPVFTSSGTSYTATVVNSVTTVTVTPTVSDSTATVQVTGGIGLVVGSNTITAKVTAQDGVTSKTYKIVVTRQPSSNADLFALAITGGTLSPAFASSGASYTATVANSVTSVTVTPTVSDSTATVQVTGGTGLVVGGNVVTAKVTAQDGATMKTYTIIVTRLPSSNADLSALAITSATLSPAFASSGTSYTATVANSVTSVTVTRTVSDSTATAQVTGGTGLVVGSNTITVTVTAQDGTTTKTYAVVVNRLPSSNANLSALTITSGSLSPVFTSSGTNYAATVANSVTDVTVTTTLSDSTATVQLTGGIGLIVGANMVTAKVTAQDGTTTKIYTVLVNRLPSTNANLSALAISSGSLSPAFTSNGTSYTATVANSVTSLTVTPTVSDSTATVQVTGGTGLVVGGNVVTAKVTAQDGVTIKTYTIIVTRLPSSDADLSALAISGGSLSPAFTSNGTSYTATVANSVTSLTVTPTVSDSTATVQVTGGTGLVVGSNVVTAKVTAQDGVTIKTYTIVVTRLPSSNADLSALAISGGSLSPAFTPTGTSYTTTVENSVTGVTATPTLSDSTATAEVTGGTALVVGDNTITAKVTAQDGVTTKTYTILVNRLPSSNADLSALTITSGTLSPVFASSGISYTATVANSVTSVTATATVFESTSTVELTGGADLVVGDNTITAKVTAQDGVTTKTYTVLVKRLPSSNADLSALAITSGTLSPEFASSGTNYTATVPNSVTSVTVTPTVSDSTSTVFVTGGTDLVVGDNTITATVTAQDGATVKNYTIIVNRASSRNADLSALSLSSGALSPAFISSGTTYVAYVDGTTVAVTPTVSDTTANVQVRIGAGAYLEVASGFASPRLALIPGANLLEIKVTAEDGVMAKTYQVFVISQRPETNTVACKWDGAPGIAGAAFSTFGNPAINDSENVAYQATVSGSGITSANASGIWAEIGTGATAHLIARSGQNTPGVAGGVFATFGDPVYNNGDRVAFMGTMKLGPGGVSASNANGIWANPAGVLKLIARTGVQAPGCAAGAMFASFGKAVLTAQNGVVFLGNLVVGSGGVTTLNNQGVWSMSATGQTKLLVRSGNQLSVNGGARTLSAISIFASPSYDGGQTRSFNSAGTLIFAASFRDGTQGVLTVSATGTVLPVVTNSSIAPGLTGAKFATFGSPIENKWGHISFRAGISGSGITAANNSGIWADKGRSRLLVTRTGLSAPGAAGGVFAVLGDPVYNGADQVAFRGVLTAGVAGITSTNSVGIWANTTGALALVARTQSQAVMCPAGARFSLFRQFALPEAGGVIFLADLELGGGGVTAANNQGIWVADSAGKLKLVARKGDGIVIDGAIRKISTLTIFTSTPEAGAQTRSFNISRHLVYRAGFTDGTQGVFETAAP